MNKPVKNPLDPIVPAAPGNDRQPTVIRSNDSGRGLFQGWGPKL